MAIATPQSNSGVWVYGAGGKSVKVSDRVPLKGEPRPLSFRENIIKGYRQEELKGARFAHKAPRIRKVWNF